MFKLYICNSYSSYTILTVPYLLTCCCCISWKYTYFTATVVLFFTVADPGCLHPGSRTRIKEFKYFNPKIWFLSSRKFDPVVHPGSGCRLSTHPGSRIQGSTRHQIPDPDPQHWLLRVMAEWEVKTNPTAAVVAGGREPDGGGA